MVQQKTNNIIVSIDAKFEGTFFKDHRKQYAFSYAVSIENLSNEPIQLKSRFWIVKDALNQTDIIKGNGVIGEQPIIQPMQSHHYNSGCIMISPFGCMKGHYLMETASGQQIEVSIPLFRLSAPFAMN